mmetsp:Transcript_7324/g.16636  ORF Transcript_7324/g.16636 Transcript_7324/m.16636 type:complete len:243 (+) Transcript_7324:672-1400(+)
MNPCYLDSIVSSRLVIASSFCKRTMCVWRPTAFLKNPMLDTFWDKHDKLQHLQHPRPRVMLRRQRRHHHHHLWRRASRTSKTRSTPLQRTPMSCNIHHTRILFWIHSQLLLSGSKMTMKMMTTLTMMTRKMISKKKNLNKSKTRSHPPTNNQHVLRIPTNQETPTHTHSPPLTDWQSRGLQRCGGAGKALSLLVGVSLQAPTEETFHVYCMLLLAFVNHHKKEKTSRQKKEKITTKIFQKQT